MKKNQNNPFKRHNWFDTKQCNICKKQGTTFRYFNQKHQYVICDNKNCDLMTRVKAGYFGGLKILKGVNDYARK